MNKFSILKIDDEYSLKQCPLVGSRLDPTAVSPNRSGVTTAPIDGVTALLIRGEIFEVCILNNLRAGNILHLFHY
jgi:hypothetical protein